MSLIRHIPLYLAVLIMCSPIIVYGSVYKWTDSNGNVHYGSARPADQESKRMNVTKTNKNPYQFGQEKKASKTDKEKIAEKTTKEEQKKQEEQKKRELAKSKAKEKNKLSKKEKKSRCANATKNLRTIESRGRIRAKDKNGEWIYLPDSERNSRLKAAKENVKTYCR